MTIADDNDCGAGRRPRRRQTGDNAGNELVTERVELVGVVTSQHVGSRLYRRTVTVTGSGDQIISQSPLAYWETLADVSGGKKVSDCTVLSEGRPGLSNHRVGEGANPVVQPIHSRQFFIGLPGWYIPSSIPPPTADNRWVYCEVVRHRAIHRVHREMTPEHSAVQCRR